MDINNAGRKYQDESQLTRVAGNVDGNELDNDHEFKTAPLLTRGAYRTKKMRQAVGQYGVFGTIAESKYDDSDSKTSHSLIFLGYLILPRRCKTTSSRGCTLTRQVTLYRLRFFYSTLPEYPVFSTGMWCTRFREIAHGVGHSRKHVRHRMPCLGAARETTVWPGTACW